MTALPPTSRFQIVDRPVAHPGKCVVCGATDRPVIDWNMDIEDFGTVYVCLDCGAEMARALGFSSPDEVEAIRLEAGQSIDAYLEARGEKVIPNELMDALSNCVAVYALTHGSSTVHLDAPVVDAGGQESGSEPDPVRQDDEASGEVAGQVDKPTRSRRSASVPADSSNDLGLNFNL